MKHPNCSISVVKNGNHIYNNDYPMLIDLKNNPMKIKSLDIILDTYRIRWKEFNEIEL